MAHGSKKEVSCDQTARKSIVDMAAENERIEKERNGREKKDRESHSLATWKREKKKSTA